MANRGTQALIHRTGITGVVLLLLALPCLGSELPTRAQPFFDSYCVTCHDTETKKGGLDLTDLCEKALDPTTFDRWVKVFDLVESERMPPHAENRPDST